MKVVLAEKPSVARDLATFLGANTRHEGYFEGNGYQVTWAFGHMVSLKEPEHYDPFFKKWSIATLPIIPSQFQLQVIDDKGTKKQFGIIKKLMKAANELIVATDAGREGELIFRYIQTMAECTHKPWKRLWLSSLTEEALQVAFKNMKPGKDYDNLYAAAKCRSEADWIVGLNATRNFTVRFGGGNMLWSVGRVQTPVLAMLVNRDDEIRHFKKEPFWEVLTKYRDVVFKLKGDRFSAKEKADAILNKITGHPFVIQKVASKSEQELPPQLFDLTELQKEMNRRLGMSAADTLQIAQTLYEQKFITYPRTDSRYLSGDMKGEVVKVLKSLLQIKEAEIKPLNLEALSFSNRIINDKKVTDHHAIIPTGKIPGAIANEVRLVYEAIVLKTIAIFYPPCVKEVTTVLGASNQEPFQARGIRVLSPGWTALYSSHLNPGKFGKEAAQVFGLERATIAGRQGASEDQKLAAKPTLPKFQDSGGLSICPKVKQEDANEKEEQQLPLFKEGESGPHFPYVLQGYTKPPSHYTENSLLGAMETAGRQVEDEALKEALKEKGLGTVATRASIIEILLKRGYIVRKGKSLLATDLGRYLIAIIYDPNLKSAELTGDWESRLKKMEQGKFSSLDFMEEIARFTKQVIVSSDMTKIEYESYGPCPKCKSQIIKGRVGYGCSRWKEGCSFVLWKEHKGKELNEGQIRCLLQRRVLLDPIDGAILSFSLAGDLMEIPIPVDRGVRKTFSPKRSKF